MAMIMNTTKKQEHMSRYTNKNNRGERRPAVPTYKIYKKGEFG